MRKNTRNPPSRGGCLTNAPRLDSCNFPVIGRLPRLLCFLLALAWVPVTQHCELEALGVIASQCNSAGHADGHSCRGDTCDAVESGAYKPASGDLKLASPVLLACTFTMVAGLAATIPPVADIPAPTATEPPRELRPTWQFVHRAAPLSRAPSAIAA